MVPISWRPSMATPPQKLRFPCQGAMRRPEARPCWSTSRARASPAKSGQSTCVYWRLYSPRACRGAQTADCQFQSSPLKLKSKLKSRPPKSKSPRLGRVPRRDGGIPKAACSRSSSRGADRQTVGLSQYTLPTWRQVAQKMSSISFLQSLVKSLGP